MKDQAMILPGFKGTRTFVLAAVVALAWLSMASAPAAACEFCHDGKDAKHAQDEGNEGKKAKPATALVYAGPAITHTASIAIEGMTCSGCSKGIQRTLTGQKGVLEATVRFKDKRAVVTFDPTMVDAAALVRAVDRDSQYQAALAESGLKATAFFDVDGMTCGGCAKNVKAALAKVKGFTAAVVNLKSKSAVVDFDPALTHPKKLLKAINGAGYKAKLHSAVKNGKAAKKNGKSARMGQLRDGRG